MDKHPDVDFHYLRADDKYHLPGQIIHNRRFPTQRAEFAMRMMERFGLILGDDDGEDTAGRQKGRRLSPKEAAALACDTADELFNEMETRDWFIPVPSLEEMEEQIQARENKKENGGFHWGKK